MGRLTAADLDAVTIDAYGTLVTSDQNFARFRPGSSLDEVNLGLVKLRPGVVWHAGRPEVVPQPRPWRGGVIAEAAARIKMYLGK